MLQFLQPLWLWAATAVVIPVAIHLWNIQEGKTLKVGSILLYTESVKASATRLRISQWLLLLLRCLLIIVSALLLAKPFINVSVTGKDKGWIVVEKSYLREAYKAYGSLIDSLQAQHYTLHYLNDGFATANLKDTASVDADSTGEIAGSYWSKLKELEDTLPGRFPVYMFTNNRLIHFQGNRPQTQLSVKWYTFPSKDKSVKWISEAFRTASDSVRVIVSHSNATGTFHTAETLMNQADASGYTLTSSNGNMIVKSGDSLTGNAIVDTSVPRIVIYADKYADDAVYVKSAILAIRDFTQYNIQVSSVKTKENLVGNYDWLFWLSDEIIPQKFLKNNVLMYMKGEARQMNSSLVANEETQLSVADGIRLYQSVGYDSSTLYAVWKNGYGETLLSRKKDSAIVYHFYSRFHPQWTDLVWKGAFPQVIYHLLFDGLQNNDTIDSKDLRVMSDVQILPQTTLATKSGNTRSKTTQKDVSNNLWIGLFVIFFTERFVSFRLNARNYA